MPERVAASRRRGATASRVRMGAARRDFTGLDYGWRDERAMIKITGGRAWRASRVTSDLRRKMVIVAATMTAINQLIVTALVVGMLSCLLPAAAQAEDWKPAAGPLMTR